ncbi:MAG: S-layer homology domain-containing protein [Candidatus Saganbacteria bacterium]|nr:S-layer homology domain-containing protein [Candidatus Saganbacteria bacterium]
MSFVIAPAGADTGTLSDPMTIGVGARPLGMGKAYTAVAEDGDAIFTNPAGLARSASPKLTSMYASLMGDVSYVVVGGVYPYGEKSAIGAGYIGSALDGIPLTDASGASLGSGRWGSNVMFLSYGTYLNELGIIKLDQDILIGANLKYFSLSGGGGSNEANGTGYDLDLGVLYPVNPYVMVGANLQNALPGSMGKITYASGAEDAIQHTLKVGAKVNLIGDENALTASEGRRLYGTADYDYNFSRPSATHFGLEFWPTANLALRGGMDGSDPTAGLGLRVSGVEFNYAYHPYSQISENTTHYFSLGYLGEARKRQINITLDEPKDKAVIYEDHVRVKGRVQIKEGDEPAPKGPLSLKVNGIDVAVAPDGSFAIETPVQNYGKKLVQATAVDAAGNSAQRDARIVRLISFADVPDGYWAKMPIENNATVGLVQGYPDGNFKPDRALSRAELATLLVRAKGIKLPEGRARQSFKDVKPDFWAAKYIDAAQREGLVLGYPDKTFRPNNKINKVEGIAIMVRFDQLKLAEVDSKPYWDIATNHWGAKYVQAAKEAGMLSFIERNRLRPKEQLARSESVEMLGKTALAGGKIKDLYTWEKGFKPELEKQPTIRGSLDNLAEISAGNYR